MTVRPVPPFGLAPSYSSVTQKGTCISKIPSFMPHFLRKPDHKRSPPSLPLYNKAQSNNPSAADHNPSPCRHFRRFDFSPVPSISRMESNSQTSPFSAMQWHKFSQDVSTGCISMAVFLTPILLLSKWIQDKCFSYQRNFCTGEVAACIPRAQFTVSEVLASWKFLQI